MSRAMRLTSLKPVMEWEGGTRYIKVEAASYGSTR